MLQLAAGGGGAGASSRPRRSPGGPSSASSPRARLPGRRPRPPRGWRRVFSAGSTSPPPGSPRVPRRVPRRPRPSSGTPAPEKRGGVVSAGAAAGAVRASRGPPGARRRRSATAVEGVPEARGYEGASTKDAGRDGRRPNAPTAGASCAGAGGGALRSGARRPRRRRASEKRKRKRKTREKTRGFSGPPRTPSGTPTPPTPRARGREGRPRGGGDERAPPPRADDLDLEGPALAARGKALEAVAAKALANDSTVVSGLVHARATRAEEEAAELTPTALVAKSFQDAAEVRVPPLVFLVSASKLRCYTQLPGPSRAESVFSRSQTNDRAAALVAQFLAPSRTAGRVMESGSLLPASPKTPDDIRHHVDWFFLSEKSPGITKTLTYAPSFDATRQDIERTSAAFRAMTFQAESDARAFAGALETSESERRKELAALEASLTKTHAEAMKDASSKINALASEIDRSERRVASLARALAEAGEAAERAADAAAADAAEATRAASQSRRRASAPRRRVDPRADSEERSVGRDARHRRAAEARR